MLRMALGRAAASGCACSNRRCPKRSRRFRRSGRCRPTTSATPANAAKRSRARCRSAADIGWRDFFTDPKLEALIEQALANNRDLRIAMLNVERAREQYRIQRADRVPTRRRLGRAGARQRHRPDDRDVQANLAVTQFELDLWGRVRDLNESALQRYFAEEEARRSTQLALIAEVAYAYLTLAADQEQVRLAQATLTDS